MAKYVMDTPIPLDEAVIAFLSRVVQSGHPLNYMFGYTFERSSGEVSAISIRFAADEELHDFGSIKAATAASIKQLQQAVESQPYDHNGYPTRPVRDNPQA
jgi:hypothetical protein